MDKYVLVPQDRYDNILRNEKNNIPQTTENNTQESIESKTEDNLKPPPPGIPPSDEFAKSGIELTDQEAQQISEALVDIALNKTSVQQSSVQQVQKDISKTANSENSQMGWKGVWQSPNK